MSSVTWNGDKIMQHAGTDDAELGYISLDKPSGTYVLWLKDTCGVLDLNGGYIRGDEFASMAEAKEKGASSGSAFIMHYIWIRRVTKRRALEALDEHWDKISSEFDSDTKKETLRGRLAEYLDKLPINEIQKWGKRIGEGLGVSFLVDLIKKILTG